MLILTGHSNGCATPGGCRENTDVITLTPSSGVHMSELAPQIGRFEGRISRVLADSEAWFEEPPHPGEDAPNVVVVLLDDTGFAQFGCYGSTIEPPNVDALAAAGLQFTLRRNATTWPSRTPTSCTS